MREVETELQPCVYRKNGFEYKELLDFITRVEISPNKKKCDDGTPSDRFLNYRFKNF